MKKMENPINVFQLKGSEYEMGVKQGTYFKHEINELYMKLTSSEEFLASKPSLIPTFLYKGLATIISSGMIKGSIQEHFPSQWRFLEGLTEGADISLRKLLFMQAIDALGTQITNYKIEENISTSFNHCSAVGVVGSKSNTGGVLMVKNWDGPEFLAEYTIFRNIIPSGERFSTIGSGVAGLVGINNGINEKGLSIVYNYAYPKDIGDEGVPAMIIIREALETCTTVKETIELFKKYPRIGGSNVMVADKEGDLAVLEVGPSNVEVRREGDDEENDWLVCTNHYLTPAMKKLEVSRDAVYNENAAEAFRGNLVHKTSLLRYQNAREILKNDSPEQISLDYLNNKIQCSHGSENNPSEFTFCNHGVKISTGFGVMVDVDNEQFYAALGKPCKEKMQNLSKIMQ
jgi:predicted choloylglycine hydrolase